MTTTAAPLPPTMQAVVLERTGPAEALATRTVPVPSPGREQLLVRTEAIGVNFIETYQRSGVYPVDLPFVPGAEAVGEVVALGPGCAELATEHGLDVGHRVVTCQGIGTYAEYFLVEAARAVAVPEEISSRTAACLPLQGITAQYLVRSTYEVKRGQTVLFHAGAGGVGGLAIQLLKSIGATVITTVSTEEKARIAKAHGADHVLGYDDFAERTRELTEGRGVDVVYDSVGRRTFEDSLTTLRPRGMAVLFGGASGQVEPFDLQRLNALGSLYVTRPSIGAYVRDRAELVWRMGELFEDVEAGRLKVSLDTTFPLAEAARAHQYLEDRRTRGKVLLIP